ncbi:hypothetical protein [Streptomyces anthocyanicus]|uniref:hypothetical protein n=1 Tax=Streptomyces anthocyanicus TaxID=68174 RepID=UPI0038028AE5
MTKKPVPKKPSREIIYGKYAGEYKANLHMAREAYISAALAADMGETETKQTLADIFRSWCDPAEGLAALESDVREAGTNSVAASARAATRSIEHFGSLILKAVTAHPEARENAIARVKATYGATYRAYIQFLYNASECIGSEAFLRDRL